LGVACSGTEKLLLTALLVRASCVHCPWALQAKVSLGSKILRKQAGLSRATLEISSENSFVTINTLVAAIFQF
jgi:hypothetical protein